MRPDGDATQVEVLTDLAITGKPAQFGRGVMQDVSDKLLGQFVACLEQRLATGDSGAAPDTAPATTPTGPTDSAAAGNRTGSAAADRPHAPAASPEDEEALDLGAAMLPVLLKSYGKQVAIALGALLVLRLVIRMLRR
jgi:hypothetical protein